MLVKEKQKVLHKDFPAIEFLAGSSVYVSRYDDLCLTAQVRGVEPSCKSTEVLEKVEGEFLSSIGVLDPSFRFQQTLFNARVSEIDWLDGHVDPIHDASIRRRKDALSQRNLYRKDLYYTIILQSSAAKVFAMAYKLDKVVEKLSKQEHNRADHLIRRVQSVQTQLAATGIHLDILDREQTKYFLNRFIAFQKHNIERPIPQNEALDYWIPNAAPQIHPDCVWHDGHYLQAISVRELPRIPDPASNPDPRKQAHGSHAAIHVGMLDVDCEYILHVDWSRVNDKPMKKRLNGLHKSWDNKIVSVLSDVFAHKNDTRSDMRQDTSAVDKRDELGRAMSSLNDQPWGEYACSVILHGPDKKSVQAQVPNVFTALKGATVHQETVGIYDVWTNYLPGNHRRQTRTLYAPSRAAADTFLIWNDDCGSLTNSQLPSKRAFSIVETKHNGIAGFNINEGPVTGVEIFGAQGSGKTFLANHIAERTSAQWVKIAGKWIHPKMLILDMKDSYRENTLLHGGTYLKISLNDPELKSNPWSLDYSANSVEVIKRLIKAMVSGDDGYITSPEEDSIITKQIEAQYIQKDRAGLRYARLQNIHLGKEMQKRLDPWIGSGQYARFFDNDVDELAIQNVDWLTVQFSGFAKHSYVLQPILYWHWERFMTLVNDPALARVPKLTLIDEAHEQMMMSPQIGERMLTGINTGRSYNLWNVFVMQWAHLLQTTQYGPALNTACPVKIFTQADIIPETYAEIFDMPLYVAQQIPSLRPQGEFLRYSKRAAQKFKLTVDPATAAVYSNDPESIAERYERTLAVSA